MSRPTKRPWPSVEVGQKILVPLKPDETHLHLQRSLSQWARLHGRKFKTRSLAGNPPKLSVTRIR